MNTPPPLAAGLLAATTVFGLAALTNPPAQASSGDDGPRAQLVASRTDAGGVTTKVWDIDGHRVKSVGPAGVRLLSANIVEATQTSPGTASAGIGHTSDPDDTEDVTIEESQLLALTDGDPNTTAPAGTTAHRRVCMEVMVRPCSRSRFAYQAFGSISFS